MVHDSRNGGPSFGWFRENKRKQTIFRDHYFDNLPPPNGMKLGVGGQTTYKVYCHLLKPPGKKQKVFPVVIDSLKN